MERDRLDGIASKKLLIPSQDLSVAQHVETSCVAGINEQGAMRCLYPVPFRLIEEGQKFKKWLRTKQMAILRAYKAR